MKDRSSMGWLEFLIDCIINGLIAMIGYNNILFRCLDDLTYTESKIFLFIIFTAAIILGTFLFFKYNRSRLTIAICLILPFGFYTILAYINTVKMLILISMSIAILASIIYSIFILIRKINKKQYKKIIIKNRLYKCFCITQLLISLGMTVIMISLGISILSGKVIMTASTPSESGNMQKYTISNNIETVLLLQENEWKKLSTKEKLNVLQIIANIEAHSLGLPNELNVGTANLEEYTRGSYLDGTHTIYINLTHLENDSVYEVLNTCCHEAYHSYQYRVVDTYNESDKKLQNLMIYKKAVLYAEEFNNYIDSCNDFDSYYHQDCESDAREYAETEVYNYYNIIHKHLESNQKSF